MLLLDCQVIKDLFEQVRHIEIFRKIEKRQVVIRFLFDHWETLVLLDEGWNRLLNRNLGCGCHFFLREDLRQGVLWYRVLPLRYFFERSFFGVVRLHFWVVKFDLLLWFILRRWLDIFFARLIHQLELVKHSLHCWLITAFAPEHRLFKLLKFNKSFQLLLKSGVGIDLILVLHLI